MTAPRPLSGSYTLPQTPPETLARWTAGVLRDGRRVGFCSEERPRCIGGHQLKLAGHQRMPRTEGLLTCTYRAARDSEPCGLQSYWALITIGGSARIRGTGERTWLVVEVTPEHAHEMHTKPMIFLETLALLSLALPGVDLDLHYTVDPEDAADLQPGVRR